MTQWRIHIGAHKTATTHLQATLDGIADELRPYGVAVATMSRLRGETGHLLRKPGLRRRLAVGFSQRRHEALGHRGLTALLGALGAGAERVILSEENWIGEAFEGAACPPYPAAATRLSRILAALPDGEVTLYLAIRHPADFATSIYAEALRHNPGKVSALQIRAQWLSVASPWADLVARIRGSCPAASLVVWRYEDYRALRQEMTEALVGMRLPPLPGIDDPGTTIRPTPDQIAATARSRDRAAFHLLDGRFSLFSQAEYDGLTRKYAADRDRIHADDGTTEVDPVTWL